MIEDGSLFAVDLNVYEMLIHDACSGFIFETFALHHVTPVTCRITNAYKNRLVFSSCFLKGLFAPWVPLYRVMGMLQQIWTCFPNEMIAVVSHDRIMRFPNVRLSEEQKVCKKHVQTSHNKDDWQYYTIDDG